SFGQARPFHRVYALQVLLPGVSFLEVGDTLVYQDRGGEDGGKEMEECASRAATWGTSSTPASATPCRSSATWGASAGRCWTASPGPPRCPPCPTRSWPRRATAPPAPPCAPRCSRRARCRRGVSAGRGRG